MRSLTLLVSTLTVLVACSSSSSQPVQKASTCTDRCCGGDPTRLDCGESVDVTCTVSGDPCTVFGCTGGGFFKHPQTSPSCNADSGLDASMGADVSSSGDAAPAADATSEATVDAAPDATGEAGPDATGGVDAASDAAIDAPADGS